MDTEFKLSLAVNLRLNLAVNINELETIVFANEGGEQVLLMRGHTFTKLL